MPAHINNGRDSLSCLLNILAVCGSTKVRLVRDLSAVQSLNMQQVQRPGAFSAASVVAGALFYIRWIYMGPTLSHADFWPLENGRPPVVASSGSL